ncbi:MAG: AAA family ATPase [Candidatus Theseobacter exili]|nr:AAA family ATPase [Candidatus Theseobacter exili]
MLIIFLGKPGTGKTEISSRLQKIIGCSLINVDGIEKKLKTVTGLGTVSEYKYPVSMIVSEILIDKGETVIVDGNFRLKKTRDAFIQLAKKRKKEVFLFYCTCSAETAEKRIALKHDISPGYYKKDLSFEDKEKKEDRMDSEYIVLDTMLNPDKIVKKVTEILGIQC